MGNCKVASVRRQYRRSGAAWEETLFHIIDKERFHKADKIVAKAMYKALLLLAVAGCCSWPWWYLIDAPRRPSLALPMVLIFLFVYGSRYRSILVLLFGAQLGLYENCERFSLSILGIALYHSAVAAIGAIILWLLWLAGVFQCSDQRRTSEH